ncbi:MAG: tetratricopeptide repeat protein, partial [Cyanobacteriota bacterium]
MVSKTSFEQDYKQAETAYILGNYEQAATIVDRVIEEFPDEPRVVLLRGHIYLQLTQYDVARSQYEKVLELTQDPDYVDYAHNGIEQSHQLQQQTSATAEEESFAPSSVNEMDLSNEADFENELSETNSSSWQDLEVPQFEDQEDLEHLALDDAELNEGYLEDSTF